MQGWERKEKEYRQLYKEINGLKKGKVFKESKDNHCVFFEFFDCEKAKYRETFHCMGC